MISNKKFKCFDNNAIIIWGIQTFVWIMLALYHADTSYITRVVLLIVTVLLLLCNYIKTNSYTPLIKVLNYIIFIQAVFAAVGFFLVLSGLLQPLLYYDNVDMRQGEFYLLTCTNTRVVNFIRVSGYFDEPGAFAFWGIFSLIFNKLFVGNKRIEIGLMLCLLFTFSMAYLLELVLYLVLLGKGNFKRIAIVVAVVAVLANYLSKFDTTSNEVLNHLIFERVDTNLNEGNERNDMSQRAIKHFKASPILGAGAERLESIEYIGDNPYEILAKDGIVGYLVVYLPLLMAFIKGNKKEKLAVLILFVDYQQRPFHINPMHFLYLDLFLLAVLLQNKRATIFNEEQSPLLKASM